MIVLIRLFPSKLLCRCSVIIYGCHILVIHIRITVVLAKALEHHELLVLDFSCDGNVSTLDVKGRFEAVNLLPHLTT
jgi:hypothetical protein